VHLLGSKLKKNRKIIFLYHFFYLSFFREALERDGSMVDAAVAAMFCNSLLQSSSMGPGGGLVMTIYQKSTGKVETLIARERAPLAATVNMFEGDPDLAIYGKMFR
jgi:gamma-glutamyltranspeptidase/glutathione hydrolase/leukotriene-C4 hydrolase